jgi:hypothetical protein
MMPTSLLLRIRRTPLQVDAERRGFVSPLPVSAKRLANRTVIFSDARVSGCALLPLFDGRGITRKVVLLSTDTRECRVVDWRPDLIYVPMLRAARVDVTWSTPQQPPACGPLWFYGPRGLGEACTNILRGDLAATDCASILPKSVVALLWWRNLSRISGAWIKKGSGIQFGRWKTDWLPAPPPPPTAESSLPAMPNVPMRPTGEWVLDPIWMRRKRA